MIKSWKREQSIYPRTIAVGLGTFLLHSLVLFAQDKFISVMYSRRTVFPHIMNKRIHEIGEWMKLDTYCCTSLRCGHFNSPHVFLRQYVFRVANFQTLWHLWNAVSSTFMTKSLKSNGFLFAENFLASNFSFHADLVFLFIWTCAVVTEAANFLQIDWGNNKPILNQTECRDTLSRNVRTQFYNWHIGKGEILLEANEVFVSSVQFTRFSHEFLTS